MEARAVEADDAGRLLPAMLQRVQAERGDGGGVGHVPDAEHAAFLVQLVVVFACRSVGEQPCGGSPTAAVGRGSGRPALAELRCNNASAVVCRPGRRRHRARRPILARQLPRHPAAPSIGRLQRARLQHRLAASGSIGDQPSQPRYRRGRPAPHPVPGRIPAPACDRGRPAPSRAPRRADPARDQQQHDQADEEHARTKATGSARPAVVTEPVLELRPDDTAAPRRRRWRRRPRRRCPAPRAPARAGRRAAPRSPARQNDEIDPGHRAATKRAGGISASTPVPPSMITWRPVPARTARPDRQMWPISCKRQPIGRGQRAVAAGHPARQAGAVEAELRRLLQPRLGLRHLPDLAGQADLAEIDHARRWSADRSRPRPAPRRPPDRPPAR